MLRNLREQIIFGSAQGTTVFDINQTVDPFHRARNAFEQCQAESRSRAQRQSRLTCPQSCKRAISKR